MKEHQVMVFIGNGFDISVLKKYGKGITTSYDSFYSFFKYKYPNSKDNLLIQQMETAKTERKENWSDFEALLDESLNLLSKTDKEQANKLNADLSEIQQAFSQFLNDIIDNDIIKNISMANDVIIDSRANCAKKLLKCSFLKDLSEEQYKSIGFHNNFDNNESLKYIFINFNYTSLLDNYLYLTKEVFDPIPYATSSNNITLNLNPNDYNNHCGYDDPYVQLMPIDIFHPHGVQDVPKSLLFGIENRNYYNLKDCRRVFVKSLWAQCQPKYEEKFDNTELFIIYGSSIGESDSWWWHKVFTRLVDENPAELIIYNYGSENEDVIKDKFIRNCCLKDTDDEKITIAKKNIYIVNFGSSTEDDQDFITLPELNTEMEVKL